MNKVNGNGGDKSNLEALKAYYEALQTKKVQYLYASNVTTKCLQDLKLANVNIVGTIDNWIMDVRAVLRGL